MDGSFISAHELLNLYFEGKLCAPNGECDEEELIILRDAMLEIEARANDSSPYSGTNSNQQNSTNQNQGQQGSGIGQQLLSSLPQILGQLLGGGSGGGGSGGGSGFSGNGSGGNPQNSTNSNLGTRPNYSLDKPQSLQEILANPESINDLTNEELKEILDDPEAFDPKNFTDEELQTLCELSEELKKRLDEIEKEEELKEKSDKIKEAQALEEQKLDNVDQGFGYQRDKLSEISDGNFNPLDGGLLEESRMAQELAELYNGDAPLHGLAHQQELQQWWNNNVKALENGAITADQYANLTIGSENFAFQQDALANYYSTFSDDFQNWANANGIPRENLPNLTPEDAAYNLGLTMEAFNDRYGLVGDKWKASGQTPASSMENFLWHAGYPGAANVDQGGAGSCWTCLANSDAYIWRPGELSLKHNEAFSTGQVTALNGQTVDVNNYINVRPNSQESYFDINTEPANQRSPLNNLDQQVIAQFGSNRLADGGGYVNGSRNGLYQYVGLDDVRGANSSSIIDSPFLMADAITPFHASGKGKVIGIDANGDPTIKVTWNNSWGEGAEVFLPATAANFDSLRLPGGMGSLGTGGGFGSLIGGSFPGGITPGTNNNASNNNQSTNPIDEQKNQDALKQLCYQFKRLGLSETPASCSKFNLTKVAGATARQRASRLRRVPGQTFNRSRSRPKVYIPSGISTF